LNRLVGAERAIVTDFPGTTRDTIRETISIQGIPLHIVDTAGLRESRDPVEMVGISKSKEALSKADLVLWVCDATRPETWEADAGIFSQIAAGIARIQVVNKIDLIGSAPTQRFEPDGRIGVYISARTGAGLDLLQGAMLESIGWSTSGEGAYMARARHLQALQMATVHLDAAVTKTGELDVLAEELRLAQRALSSITGEFTADDLLGAIFSRFCIGK
jgi:tRNA modification GTPase